MTSGSVYAEPVFYSLLFFFSSVKASKYLAVIMPAGSATTAIPNIDEIMVITRPAVVTG